MVVGLYVALYSSIVAVLWYYSASVEKSVQEDNGSFRKSCPGCFDGRLIEHSSTLNQAERALTIVGTWPAIYTAVAVKPKDIWSRLKVVSVNTTWIKLLKQSQFFSDGLFQQTARDNLCRGCGRSGRDHVRVMGRWFCGWVDRWLGVMFAAELVGVFYG